MSTASGRYADRYWNEHDRDDYVCPDCDRHADEVDELQVHHIDRDRSNTDMDNFVGLCHVCHWVRHGSTRWRIDLDAWKTAFLSLGHGGIHE